MDADYVPPSAVERLAVARWTDDLTVKKCRCDVDVLIAAGFAALRTNLGAAALVNLRFSLTPGDWALALDRATELAQRISHAEKWHFEDRQILALARAALKHFLVPVCPECRGQRFEEIPGTRRLGKTTCKACHGTGERPLPRESSRQMRAILSLMEQDQANVNSALKGVLR